MASRHTKPQVIILCEDRAHGHFARKFLQFCGWSERDLLLRIAPGGGGAAVQWVRDNFANELRAHRSKVNKRNIALMVIVDADNMTVAKRKQQLNNSAIMNKLGLAPCNANEKVLIAVPRRNIETWFCFLDGNSVDETKDYKQSYRNCKRSIFAKKLHSICSGEGRPSLPPSLFDACTEWARFRSLI